MAELLGMHLRLLDGAFKELNILQRLTKRWSCNALNNRVASHGLCRSSIEIFPKALVELVFHSFLIWAYHSEV